jgi:hypothetical protein
MRLLAEADRQVWIRLALRARHHEVNADRSVAVSNAASTRGNQLIAIS